MTNGAICKNMYFQPLFIIVGSQRKQLYTQKNLLIIYTDYKKNLIFDDISGDFLPDVYVGACDALWMQVLNISMDSSFTGSSIKSCVSLQNLCIYYKCVGTVCLLYVPVSSTIDIWFVPIFFSFVYPFIFQIDLQQSYRLLIYISVVISQLQFLSTALKVPSHQIKSA